MGGNSSFPKVKKKRDDAGPNRDHAQDAKGNIDILPRMLQLNPPLPRVVVGGPGWDGPTGPGVANLVESGHRDDDIVWIIDIDQNGEIWCVPNQYVRAPKNITYGRTADPTPSAEAEADRCRINGEGHAYDRGTAADYR